MKKLILIGIALSLALVSCKKEESIETTNENTHTENVNDFPAHSNNYLALNLNGNTFVVDSVYVEETSSIGIGKLLIASFNIGADNNVGLSIQKLPEGTYDLNSQSNNGFVSLRNSQSISTNTSFQNNGSGSITIVENDRNNRFIKGKFNFIATSNSGTNPQTVTQGIFQANY